MKCPSRPVRSLSLEDAHPVWNAMYKGNRKGNRVNNYAGRKNSIATSPNELYSITDPPGRLG